MTWEMWLALAVVAVPGTLSLIGQLSGIWAAKDSTVVSDASKLTGSALAMVKGLEKRVERLSLRIEQQDIKINKQDKKIDKQEHELDLYKDTVQYLWLGILSLTSQLEKEGMIPEFKPKLNFRGDDDFDEDDWAWLEE